MPTSLSNLTHRLPERFTHVYPNGKLYDNKALILALGTIFEKLNEVCRRVGTQINLLHTCRNQFQCSFERSKQVLARRDVSVTKLTEEHKPLIPLINVERLICTEFLVAVKRSLLECLHQFRIHVQG